MDKNGHGFLKPTLARLYFRSHPSIFQFLRCFMYKLAPISTLFERDTIFKYGEPSLLLMFYASEMEPGCWLRSETRMSDEVGVGHPPVLSLHGQRVSEASGYLFKESVDKVEI